MLVNLQRLKKSKIHPNNSSKQKHIFYYKNPSVWKIVVEKLRYFCDITKLAGLFIIGGHRHNSKISRFLLLIVWISCIVLSIYKCVQCVNIYFAYDTKTSITFHSVLQQPFPAITICNLNMFRKSSIGLDELFMLVGTQLLTGQYKPDDSLLKLNFKSCKINDKKLLDNAVQYKQHLVESFLSGDYETSWRALTSDSNVNVEKCWWNKEEINCTDSFVNHQLENGVCYTFNQDPKFINSIKGSLGQAVYGMENVQFSKKFLSTSGPSKGFQVLLNVHAEDYCLRGLDDNGMGFRVMVHDSNAQPSVKLDSSFNLSPGYEYRISLRSTTYDSRNFSQWLGKCTMSVYSILNPNLTEYNREICFMSCRLATVWNSCDCLTVDHTSSLLQSESTASYLGTNISKLRSCEILNSKDHDCVSGHFVKYLELNPDQLCPECKRKCLETKYEFEITAKKLISTNIKWLLYNSNASSIPKNYVYISFMFNEMNTQIVRETQAFTSLHLFIYIGGTLGLFLGSSTMTIYEIVHHLFIALSILIKSTADGKKKGESRSVLFFNEPTTRL